MNLFRRTWNLFVGLFQKKEEETKLSPKYKSVNDEEPRELIIHAIINNRSKGLLIDFESPDLLVDKVSYESIQLKNTYQLFYPNWGDLDSSVSTISSGRIVKERLTYQNDEFSKKYGRLTTDLGYGLIYSIVMNAIKNEDRTVSSALREAIVRSGDPLLCVAVVKDYCQREAINFDKYEKITADIIKRRESYYTTSSGGSSQKSPIDFNAMPLFSEEEKQDLDSTKWRFNGKLIATRPENKPPLILIVRIPSLNTPKRIKHFNKDRYWMLNQNVVVQWDGDEQYRVLDFK